jgi:osmoprotectant transport system ATP-binding protein
MISVKNVTKKFGKIVVLNDLTFSLAKGEGLALLGLSGSGKTTILKILCGLQYPDEGQVLVDGLLLGPQHLTQIRKKLGYVIQDGGLFPHLTALENIKLVGAEAGLSQEQIEARIHELSRLTRLSEDLLLRYPRELSGGQRQRIGIMRALFLDPEVLLLDEPLGALDPITRHELQLELKELFKKLHKTFILVTHDLNEARILADRIILLADGKVVQEGTMKDLMMNPSTEFVRKFILAQSSPMEAL